MGRIIAFPDMKSRLHHLPDQSSQGQNLAQHGLPDNIVLFGGVFVEYHDESQKTPTTDASRTNVAHPLVAQRSDADRRHRKMARRAENYAPEKTPRLKHR